MSRTAVCATGGQECNPLGALSPYTGYYRTQAGQRRRNDGDTTKLRFAEGITSKQKHLLSDFSFRTRNVAGTQEIRTKIGHLCFWASVVYGNGIFMTISPGERHNYLAIRLSRYRRKDPYIGRGGAELGSQVDRR